MTHVQATDEPPEAIDPAIPLDSDETVAWTGRPRKTVILPAVAAGLVLCAVGIAAARAANAPLALVLVPLGLAIPGWRYLVNQQTQYVVTDRALYVKHGVFSRAVSQAALETVQNSSYSQSVTGSLFGYGSVDFEIAGGGDPTFRAIEDPQAVRTLVDRVTGASDGITGETTGTTTLPGTLDQWRQVREEVRAVREALDRQN